MEFEVYGNEKGYNANTLETRYDSSSQKDETADFPH